MKKQTKCDTKVRNDQFDPCYFTFCDPMSQQFHLMYGFSMIVFMNEMKVQLDSFLTVKIKSAYF